MKVRSESQKKNCRSVTQINNFSAKKVGRKIQKHQPIIQSRLVGVNKSCLTLVVNLMQ